MRAGVGLCVQVCVLVEVHACVRPRKPTRQRYVKTGASQLLEKRKENVTAGEELQAQREVGFIHLFTLHLNSSGPVQGFDLITSTTWT